MPNFHENFLAIAANEEDMRKVLMRFAANLYAHGKEIWDDDKSGWLNELVGLGLQDLYREVGPLISDFYMYSFAGAPNPADREDVQLGWESWACSGSPWRPIGEIAMVDLNCYGLNWALTVRYCTAWCPNTEDIDYFFLGLPAGDYGVAFYDADEFSSYDLINIISGMHHGLDVMHDMEWDLIGWSELMEDREEYSSIAKDDITDLPGLARMAVTCGWGKWL